MLNASLSAKANVNRALVGFGAASMTSMNEYRAQNLIDFCATLGAEATSAKERIEGKYARVAQKKINRVASTFNAIQNGDIARTIKGETTKAAYQDEGRKMRAEITHIDTCQFEGGIEQMTEFREGEKTPARKTWLHKEYKDEPYKVVYMRDFEADSDSEAPNYYDNSRKNVLTLCEYNGDSYMESYPVQRDSRNTYIVSRKKSDGLDEFRLEQIEHIEDSHDPLNKSWEAELWDDDIKCHFYDHNPCTGCTVKYDGTPVSAFFSNRRYKDEAYNYDQTTGQFVRI